MSCDVFFCRSVGWGLPRFLELQHVAGMVPKGSRDLEPTHLVLVGLDLFQFDYAHFGFATSGQPLQESWLVSKLICATFLGVSLKRDLCCICFLFFVLVMWHGFYFSRVFKCCCRNGLQKFLGALWGVSLLQKVSYSETARFHSSKEHPVDGKVMMPLIWNLTRFHPIWALFEMTTGIIAVRHVMLDTEEEKKKKPMNPIWMFLAAYSSLLLRLTRFDFNDAIIRGVLFVPLFTEFLTAMHRDALTSQPSAITRFFGGKVMATLGSLAFPMFIVHGPIGQIFYKKAIAKKLWGKPMPHAFFPFYLAICLGLSHLVNEYFVKNKSVGAVAGKVAQKLASWTEGMLRDRWAIAFLHWEEQPTQEGLCLRLVKAIVEARCA